MDIPSWIRMFPHYSGKIEFKSDNLLILPKEGARAIGYWDGDISRTVGTTCVLVISYSYPNSEKSRTDACEADKKLLREAFKGINARIFETSDPFEKILVGLNNAAYIRHIFQLNASETPELLILFISSHGMANGIITTHFREIIHVSRVYSAIGSNSLLLNALKLVFIGKCRGHIHEELLHTDGECACEAKLSHHLAARAVNMENRENMDAVRVVTEVVQNDLIIVKSSVESTLSFRNSNGTHLVKAFCEAFNNIENSVSLDGFLTKCMFRQKQKAVEKNCGSTMEIKALKHRELTLFRRHKFSFFSKGIKPCSYDWKSDDNISLLTRKAFVYATPAVNKSKKVSDLKDSLKQVFGFQVEVPESFDQIKQSVPESEDDVLDGCLLVCIIAPISKRGVELVTIICERVTAIHEIIYPAVAPSTAKWIGKPKIFVFLHADDDLMGNEHILRDTRKYQKTKYTRSGTLHSGLLSLVLPQQDSLELFNDTLEEFTKPMTAESTFQKFFFTLLHRSRTNVETKVDPAVISTLEMTLDMRFPLELYTDSFTLKTGDKSIKTLLMPLEEMILDENADYHVNVVSADAGSGKSSLAEFLARRAELAKRIVFFVQAKSGLLRDFDWNSGFRNFLEKCSQSQGRSFREVPTRNLVLIDDFVMSGTEGVPCMVRLMAANKVPMVLLTTPENVEHLKLFLGGICSVRVIEINKIDRENQISFLHAKLGVGREKIKEILSQIKTAQASDLSERIGTLAKIASFPGLKDETHINIFKLCKHVFDLTMQSVLSEEGIEGGQQAYRDEEKSLTEVLTMYANAYFYEGRVSDLLEKNTARFGIFRNEKSSVVVVSKALAAFLLVSNSDVFKKQMPYIKLGGLHVLIGSLKEDFEKYRKFEAARETRI